jgi:hypothetical protein
MSRHLKNKHKYSVDEYAINKNFLHNELSCLCNLLRKDEIRLLAPEKAVQILFIPAQPKRPIGGR